MVNILMFYFFNFQIRMKKESLTNGFSILNIYHEIIYWCHKIFAKKLGEQLFLIEHKYFLIKTNTINDNVINWRGVEFHKRSLFFYKMYDTFRRSPHYLYFFYLYVISLPKEMFFSLFKNKQFHSLWRYQITYIILGCILPKREKPIGLLSTWKLFLVVVHRKVFDFCERGLNRVVNSESLSSPPFLEVSDLIFSRRDAFL